MHVRTGTGEEDDEKLVTGTSRLLVLGVYQYNWKKEKLLFRSDMHACNGRSTPEGGGFLCHGRGSCTALVLVGGTGVFVLCER
jgi:hypothetical protein